MERILVQDFMKSNNKVSVLPTVGANSNGYPYVCFMDSSNKAELIYFSKKAATTVTVGQKIQRGFFDNLRVSDTINGDGELRVKLVSKGESRLEMSDLF